MFNKNNKINKSIEKFLKDLENYKKSVERLYKTKQKEILSYINNTEKYIDRLNSRNKEELDFIDSKIQKNKVIFNNSITPLFKNHKVFDETILSFNKDYEKDLFKIPGFEKYYNDNEDLIDRRNSVVRLTKRKNKLIERRINNLKKEQDDAKFQNGLEECKNKEEEYRKIIVKKEKLFMKETFNHLENYKTKITQDFENKKKLEKDTLQKLFKELSDLALERQQKLDEIQQKLDLYKNQYKSKKSFPSIGYENTLETFYNQSKNDAYKNIDGFKKYVEESKKTNKKAKKQYSWTDIISFEEDNKIKTREVKF